ncbi:MAG: glycogen debranching enzyme, partial [Nocardioidaceae bacterium]
DKHNEANGEGGADGESHNRSWNCGVEGESDDPEVQALRVRQQRNFLTTLLLSQGVPMVAHGDELGRGQRGNNNVYCQDNELAWVDWKLEAWQEELLAFSRRVVALRHEQPVFRRRRFPGGGTDPQGRPEIGWYKGTGEPMSTTDWDESHALAMMVFLNGEAIPEPDPRGEPIVGDSFLVAFNASHEDVSFVIPEGLYDEGWSVAIDTSDDQIGIVSVFDDAPMFGPGSEFPVTARSVVVLRHPSTA